MAEVEMDTKEYPKMIYKDGKGTVAHNRAEEDAFLKVPPPSAADTGDGKPEAAPLYEPPTEAELAAAKPAAKAKKKG